MSILGDALDAAIDKMMDPNAKWEASPMMHRQDALRVGKQLLEGKSITVNGETFMPEVKGEWKPTPDKDLYFILFSTDGIKSIEMALYKGAGVSEFSYCVGGPQVYTGQKVESILDADGKQVQLEV